MVANIAEKQEKRSLMTAFANRYHMEPDKMMQTLRATAFRGEVTNEQMAALILVANEYGLNPFTKEIYAFPDQRNGIVPVVGVDGWSRIVNENPQFDGMDFEQDDESCTCRIYRKDRRHPVAVTEYMSECVRSTSPWKTHPKRMLRHKAFIQCARLAFAYTGIFDEDEAERIVDAKRDEPETRAEYPDERFQANLSDWKALIESGTRTANEIIAAIESRADLTDAQKKTLRDMEILDGEVTDADS
jgi:hypothetical protein